MKWGSVVLLGLWLGLRATLCLAESSLSSEAPTSESGATASGSGPALDGSSNGDHHAAEGDQEPPASGRATADSQQAPTDAQAMKKMEERYAAARDRYRTGDLRGALRILTECYEAMHAANLLFNIGQIHRELGECESAIAFYQRYIDEAPTGERVADAQRYVDTLRTVCAPQHAVGAPPTEPKLAPASGATQLPSARPVPVAPTDSRTPTAHFWSTAGWTALGLATLATGGTVYAAIQTARASRDMEHPRMTENGFDAHHWQERKDDFYRDRAWAYALGSVAVLSIGFGVYALAIAAPAEQASTHALFTTPQPGGAAVDYRWQF